MQFLITDPNTGTKLKLSGDSPPTEQELEQIFSSLTGNQPRQQLAQQQEPDFKQQINDFILSSPAGPEIAEFGAAISRGATGVADFFINKPVNAALNLVGSKARVPLLTDELSPATKGNFLKDGLKKDIIRGAGEAIPSALAAGGLARSAVNALPVVETTAQRVIQQLGTTTKAQDAGFSAVSGVGGGLGKNIDGDQGELVGSLLAPIGAISAIQAGKKGIKLIANTKVANQSKNAILKLLGEGEEGIKKIVQPANGISEDGAGILLAEQIKREGKTPEQIISEFEKLGPDAIPADLNESFARVLRVAADRFPIISGGARNLFNARNKKAGNRLLNAFDDASGTSSLNLEDEIKRLNDVLGPQINKLYRDTRSQNIVFSPELKKLLDGKTSIGNARRKASQDLIDRKVLDNTGIKNIQIIDATKQQMDDEIGEAIRSGSNKKASRLIQLKNILVDEADDAIPVYKDARNLFAGKKSLESAGEIGQEFFKIKASELPKIVKNMGESERNMFLLGAKKAILDKVDSIGVNRQAFNSVFGKNGDLKKLRVLFSDNKGFNRFVGTMEKEGNFRLTDALVRGNSTTNRQLQESFNQGLTFRKALADTAELANPLTFKNKISSILTRLQDKKDIEQFENALQEAGNILMAKGMNSDKLFGILTRANNKEIEKALKRFANSKNAKGFETSLISNNEIEGK